MQNANRDQVRTNVAFATLFTDCRERGRENHHLHLNFAICITRAALFTARVK
jgi:hypothetical protein